MLLSIAITGISLTRSCVFGRQPKNSPQLSLARVGVAIAVSADQVLPPSVELEISRVATVWPQSLCTLLAMQRIHET